MPFTRPDLNTLIARAQADMRGRLPDTRPQLRRSLTGIIARMQGGVAHGLYGYLDWLADQLMPDTADAEHLDRWASIWGQYRKAAGHADGPAHRYGDGGGFPAGRHGVPARGRRYLHNAGRNIDRCRRPRRRHRTGRRGGNLRQRPGRNRAFPHVAAFRRQCRRRGGGRACRRHGGRIRRRPCARGSSCTSGAPPMGGTEKGL